MIRIIQRVVVLALLLIIAHDVNAQGMPPATVVVTEVQSGIIAPQSEFIGTVYYQEIAEVATEVNGVVEQVAFEEGDTVKEGDALITLKSDLLQKTIQATRASHEQVMTELASAKRDFERAEKLHQEQLMADKTYDDYKFNMMATEKKAASLGAEVERLELELQKKNVVAPYNGVIVRKNVNRGEWLATGAAVATIANYEIYDVVVEVPEETVSHVKKGMSVSVEVGGKTLSGKVLAVIPSGDVSTRTFPVKIRMSNNGFLKGGMEAKVRLPGGRKQETFVVPRDALVRKSGSTFLFSVEESKAVMIPVTVTGYDGAKVGVVSDALRDGMNIVIKGNERLQSGQPVNVIGNGKAK